ncbi:MAG: bifunctional folylpolyglutamate synthase/dihydrofolate synthase [Clostridiales bacterium]|nr:bifunctional folylpolyglutamate synthase/dihydrofolate synthase [Clostridiales bacterium]
MNYKEAMEYMEEVSRYGSVLGLDNMRELCGRLGNPQDDLRFIHIAGTNGKGSVLAYLSTVFKAAGYKTGRYISPVIFEYRERIQINGRPITKQALCECLEEIKQRIEEIVEEGLPHPTPFEIETAMAFLYFKKMKCDIVILETGMGGLSDATNIISSTVAAVFTSISMDHMQYLGKTLEEIAENKSGIIKNGCYVFSMVQEPEVLSILRKRAEDKSSPFFVVGEGKITRVKYGVEKQRFSYECYKDLEIGLAGKHQIVNAALAVNIIEVLGQAGYPVKEKELRAGLADTVWRGRFSVIGRKPLFIVDGAHNEDAAKKLAESVRFYFTDRRIIYIMGILRDKEYDKIIRETYELAQDIITVTTPGNPRAMHAYDLAREVKKFHPRVTASDSLEEAVELSYLLADKDSVIIAFGSLSYLGDLIKIVENRDKIRSDTHGKSKKD